MAAAQQRSGQKQWAVCPDPSDEGSEVKLFTAQEEAEAYRNATSVMEVPGDVLEKHLRGVTISGPVTGISIGAIRRDWTNLLPVVWLADSSGPSYPGQRFREYLPADDFCIRPGYSIEATQARLKDALEYEALSHATGRTENGVPKITCCLGEDWRFDEIQRRARNDPAYALRIRKPDRLEQRLARISHALERALIEVHSNLTAESVAAFWTSWQVWRHLEKWSREISLEMKRRKIDVDYAGDVRAAHAIQQEAYRFAQMVKGSAEAAAAVAAEHRAAAGKPGGRPVEKSDCDGSEIKRIRGTASQPVFARLCRISVDVLQDAEAGKATPKTLSLISKYAKVKGHQINGNSLKKATAKSRAN